MAHYLGVTSPRPRMTFEEFLRSSYERAEWVNGEVFELSPENVEHAGVGGWLYSLLRAFVEERGLGQVLNGILMKTGAHLAGRVPDVLFLSREHEGRIRRNHVLGPADLAIEVVSPDREVRDRETKRHEYEQGGVLEYWIVDLQRNEVTFLSLEDGRYRPLPIEADGAVRSRVISGLWLRPEWLIAEPRPKLLEVQRAWGLV